MLSVGDQVSSKIKVLNLDEKETSLASVKKKFKVVYFYPKDNTPGCTQQACAVRDETQKFLALGAEVIGVSKDPVKSHKKFIEKFDLNFALWSDPSHELMDAFGTWQKKKLYGREFYNTTRSTFLLDEKNKIVQVWEKASPTQNAQEVLSFLKTL
jgi:peroxiredoxin Q/BCP